ncbi:hypothetical protein OG749_36095 [Streptomyces nojiriensis]|uniref:hypothetical protein n=1 Tax=Streptomyces nojiriensis TaxID=66374 RepID=UPI002E18CAC7
MNASNTVWACIGTAVGICLIATYGWDAWHKGRTRRRLQRTARQAARTSRVAADVARVRAARTVAVETQPGDPYSDDRIAAELCFIPHQTRRSPRTEDPK